MLLYQFPIQTRETLYKDFTNLLIKYLSSFPFFFSYRFIYCITLIGTLHAAEYTSTVTSTVAMGNYVRSKNDNETM